MSDEQWEDEMRVAGECAEMAFDDLEDRCTAANARCATLEAERDAARNVVGRLLTHGYILEPPNDEPWWWDRQRLDYDELAEFMRSTEG